MRLEHFLQIFMLSEVGQNFLGINWKLDSYYIIGQWRPRSASGNIWFYQKTYMN